MEYLEGYKPHTYKIFLKVNSILSADFRIGFPLRFPQSAPYMSLWIRQRLLSLFQQEAEQENKRKMLMHVRHKIM